MPDVNRTVDIGGPAPLSFRDVVAIYSRLLGRQVRIRTSPPIVFKALSYALRPISAEAANIMALNYLFATVDAVVPAAEPTATEFGVKLTDAETFLAKQVAVSMAY